MRIVVYLSSVQSKNSVGIKKNQINFYKLMKYQIFIFKKKKKKERKKREN